VDNREIREDSPGLLFKVANWRPQYAQIYVLDPKEASKRRLTIFAGLDPDVVSLDTIGKTIC
jgi:hypothetical protein